MRPIIRSIFVPLDTHASFERALSIAAFRGHAILVNRDTADLRSTSPSTGAFNISLSIATLPPLVAG